MEAPDRLYLSRNIYDTFLYQVPNPDDETAVEYTRADVIIEKAVERLKDYLDNGVWVANDVGVREKEVIIDDFVKYMKGE